MYRMIRRLSLAFGRDIQPRYAIRYGLHDLQSHEFQSTVRRDLPGADRMIRIQHLKKVAANRILPVQELRGAHATIGTFLAVDCEVSGATELFKHG
jgi:hypothetical protein